MADAPPLVGFVDRTGLDALYGCGAADAVYSARALVVGAGGVGCELVKNLGCAGFSHITLIDLDTIDVSNLNRQFLFRRVHVNRAKAEVAARAVESMVDGLEVEGLVGNIKEPRFDLDYFRRFDVICNALDNLDARRHVNRMCLSTEAVLIESGSTGYNGQVTVIKKGKECYDCYPKPAPKSYAVCTIRSTPEKPIHCIVWAKHLWDLVFGPDDESNVLRDLDGGGAGGDQNDVDAPPADPEVNFSNGTAGITDQQHMVHEDLNSSDEPKRKAKRVRYENGESGEVFANRVCERVFQDDIEDQAAMTTLWEKRHPPTPFDVASAADATPANLGELNLLESRVWSREESAAVFKAVLIRVIENRSSEIGCLTFDKDDSDALAFVVAASNLRAAVYGLDLQSPFTVKGIAGNIVHAIATTNAMVAGLVVLEAIKVVVNKGEVHDSVATFVRKIPTGNPGRRRALLCSEPINDPNPSCYVCSKRVLHLSIDIGKSNLKVLVEGVCKKGLGLMEPTISVKTGEFYNTLYESGEGLEEEEVELYDLNLAKTLDVLRVESGSQLDIDDSVQNCQYTIIVSNVTDILQDAAPVDRFELAGKTPSLNDVKDSRTAKDLSPCQENHEEDTDVVEEVPVAGKKRRVDAMFDDTLPSKKLKVGDSVESGAPVVDLLD
jgi:ubiquitin-like 1-activating enzyme E1 B